MRRAFVFTDDEKEFIKDARLLTDKPVLYVCNVDEASVKQVNAHTQKFMESVKDENAEVILISAAIEADIAELGEQRRAHGICQDMGLDEPGVNRVIGVCYKLLNLITYFLPCRWKSVRWTIHRGDKAPQAAGVIHTDFEKGFIRAEVIKYEDFYPLRIWSCCQEAGKMGGREGICGDGWRYYAF